jgi:hypothetical protein
MRKLSLACVAAVAAMAIPSAASAADGPPVVFTSAVVGSATVPFAGPCGGPGTVTIEFHDMFHITEFADGTGHVSGNQNGTFAFVPDDPSAPSSTGHYRNGFSSSITQNSASDTSVFNINGKLDNGDHLRVQIRSHFTFANGEVRVGNFSVSCG